MSDRIPACWSMQDAATQLGVHPETLRRLCRDGKGPTVTRVGARLVIREDHAMQWLDSKAERGGQVAA